MLQRLWIAGAKRPKSQKYSSVVNGVFLLQIASNYLIVKLILYS